MSPAGRRAFLFLALSAALVAASLVLELFWQRHVGEAIELGAGTPPQMQDEIGSELRLFGIGLRALAIVRTLVAIPTGIVWALWAVQLRRRPLVIVGWALCTLATFALWVRSFLEIRSLSGRAVPRPEYDAALALLHEGASVAVETDLLLLVVAIAALVLVRMAKRATGGDESLAA